MNNDHNELPLWMRRKQDKGEVQLIAGILSFLLVVAMLVIAVYIAA